MSQLVLMSGRYVICNVVERYVCSISTSVSYRRAS